MNNKDAAAAERLRSKLTSTEEGKCWPWGASRTPSGYGQIRFRGSVWLAHRAAYTLFVGKIPDGLEIDHTCQVRLCCNPSHLEPVTGPENIRRYLESAAYRERQLARYARACSSPHLVADVALIITATGQKGIHTVDLLAALGDARPDVYGGWDAERLSDEVAAAGVRRGARQVKINGVNLAGYMLTDFTIPSAGRGGDTPSPSTGPATDTPSEDTGESP